MGWFIAIIAIIGIYLNAAGKWQGFGCWLISNAYWAYHNAAIGEDEQAVLFAILWLISLYGLFIWREVASKRQERERMILSLVSMLMEAEKQLNHGKAKVKVNDLLYYAKKILEKGHTVNKTKQNVHTVNSSDE